MPMEQNKNLKGWIIKQNILKNLSVVFLTAVLILWSKSYMTDIKESAVDIFVLVSVFPLGAMFAYFAFSYGSTNLKSSAHRALADLATAVLLTIICFSIAFTTALGIISIPQLTLPFIALAALLISGCLIYDFWDLYSNLEKEG